MFDTGLSPLVTVSMASQIPTVFTYFEVVSLHFVDEGATLSGLRASFIPPGQQRRASLSTRLAQGPGGVLTHSRVSGRVR